MIFDILYLIFDIWFVFSIFTLNISWLRLPLPSSPHLPAIDPSLRLIDHAFQPHPISHATFRLEHDEHFRLLRDIKKSGVHYTMHVWMPRGWGWGSGKVSTTDNDSTAQSTDKRGRTGPMGLRTEV